MMVPDADRRQQARQTPSAGVSVDIGVRLSAGALQAVNGTVVDFSESGVGVETRTALRVGDLVTLWGPFFKGGSSQHKAARIVHCRYYDGGGFRAGCAYAKSSPRETSQRAAPRPAEDSFVDYYEVLQVSPNASMDTIQRVYRMLAQLYHPDNKETGNAEAFQSLLRAYQVLSDPEKRAKYDVEYHADRTKRWKIFDQTKAAQGAEAEKRKRWGVLSILYTKRMEDPEHPGLRQKEFEQLLGCPREHLHFSFWYLNEQGLIRLQEHARWAITAKGVDAAEKAGLWKPQQLPPLLEEGLPEEPSGEEN